MTTENIVISSIALAFVPILAGVGIRFYKVCGEAEKTLQSTNRILLTTENGITEATSSLKKASQYVADNISPILKNVEKITDVGAKHVKKYGIPGTIASGIRFYEKLNR